MKEEQENAYSDYCNNGYCDAYDDKPPVFSEKHLSISKERIAAVAFNGVIVDKFAVECSCGDDKRRVKATEKRD